MDTAPAVGAFPHSSLDRTPSRASRRVRRAARWLGISKIVFLTKSDAMQLPEIGEGEALVRVEWISLDPTNRTWLYESPTYLPPVGIGEVMRGLGLGRVVRSKHPRHPEGQLVAGLLGWQEWAVISDATMLRTVPDMPGVPPSAHLGVLGTTGLTAWVGMTDIGRPQPNETVVVSAAGDRCRSCR